MSQKSTAVFPWLQVMIPIGILAVFGIGWVLFLRRPQAAPPPPPKDAAYRQASLPVETRISDLIERMTLDEKIGQMALVEKNSVHDLHEVASYGLGAILSGAGAKPSDNTPEGWFQMVKSFDDASRSSRLGIPVLYGVDANHGNGNVPGSTVFPHFIGLGATGDADLVTRVAHATAEELIGTGVAWSYSPTLDLPQDIRWGRTYEAFSDDPTLAGQLGAAYIRGTQTPMKNSNPMGLSVVATAKHFVGPGSMVWGTSSNSNFKIDQGNTIPDQAALESIYLPPYQQAVNAGVRSVMVGLNSWGDGAWMSYQRSLITDSLKGKLGFSGFVVSDWYGVYEHQSNQYTALVDAVNAGVDMVMLPFDYKTFLMNMRLAVESGDIPQSRINDAVHRILLAKFESGVVDRPITEMNRSFIGSSDHRAIAREAVVKSLVLLKNEHATLPLSPRINSLLIAGSAADNVGRQSGAWTVEWQGIDGNWLPGGTSILQGIKQTVSSSTRIAYDRDGKFATSTMLADVGIAVISEKPYAEGWGDNERLNIDQADLDAISRLQIHCKRVVVVLISGRPMMIADELPKWDAFVEAWLPGSEGEGVADVLFGKRPFTGKLPLPWPANTTQLPISTNGKTVDGKPVLFSRGFGL